MQTYCLNLFVSLSGLAQCMLDLNTLPELPGWRIYVKISVGLGPVRRFDGVLYNLRLLPHLKLRI